VGVGYIVLVSLEGLRQRIAAQQTRFFAIFMQWTDPHWGGS
jgi:hypothetical protein